MEKGEDLVGRRDFMRDFKRKLSWNSLMKAVDFDSHLSQFEGKELPGKPDRNFLQQFKHL